MRRFTFGVLLCAVMLAWPAAAQEQRGSIEGVVKDAQGGVLPGATIVAQNTGTGTSVQTTTDSGGVFRFPALAPGLYDVTAELAGFNTVKFAAVSVALGQVKRLDFGLAVAGLTEQVVVTAESPLVDVKQSQRATSIRAEQIDLLPKGRDFTTLVTQAAGANNEAGKLGGLSIDGASAGENRFIVDGIETTSLLSGTSGKNVIADFVEEVQVKSSGYAAEYGGALGGVINVMTKSGTNAFRGSALANFESDALIGENRPVLRKGITNNAIAEYWTYPEDGFNRFEPGFALGGPIAREKMWFFGAYQPSFSTTKRTVDSSTNGNPSSTIWDDIEQDLTVHYLTGNVTNQISDKIRTRVAYNNSWAKTEGQLPSQAGTTGQSANMAVDTTNPNWSISGNVDWVATPSFYIGARAGYYFADTFNDGVPNEIRYLYSQGNQGLAGVPADFQHAQNFANIPTNSSSTRDEFTRLYFQTDATWYANLAGQHTIKGGIQWDDVGNNVLTGEQKNLVRLQWNRSLDGMRGAYGYYQVRSNGAYPEQGFVTEGDVSTANVGLFIQDSWTLNNRLTVNLGLRTEKEQVPTYVKDDPTVPEYAIEWGFGTKLAPRVGFAWDLAGDGRWKAYGSWGIFYDIFKLQLPRGSFGGDKWLEYYYTLDTYDYNTLLNPCPNGPTVSTRCSGTPIREAIDFRHVSLGGYVDPDLAPFEMQETAFGFDHQLSARMAVGVRYVNKRVIKGIEDTGAIDANQNEIYTIANPGFGYAEFAYPGVKLPKAKRDYDSVEFSFDKRFADNWSFRASYMWSRLHGNYSGLSQSDENGRTSPNVGRAFDYPLMMFDGNGQGVYGRLATDRPHQFKMSGIYQFGFGLSAGANVWIASGIPVTREVQVIPPNNFPMQYLGRESDGRMPTFSQTDLNLVQEFRMGGNKRLQVSFNVLNLFNQDTATNFFPTITDGTGIRFDEAAFYAGQVDIPAEIVSQGVPLDPRFLLDNGYQNPIAARFGVKFLF